VDDATGGWGHINVDQIMLADTPARPATEAALWFDYGKDFYAAISWSDVPKADGRRLWIGWMNNWQYGHDEPTSPWRSTMSIPREVGLRRTAEGIRLVQAPVREMELLRDRHYTFNGGTPAEANAWLAKHHLLSNQFEMIAGFEPERTGIEGVKVLKGGGEETVIGVDRDGGRVFVDRTHSGNVNFNPQFSGVQDAPLPQRDGAVKLHIFVDASSVEVFVNDGERVLTDLVYPAADSRGLEWFGPESGAKIGALDLWTLKSIWK